MSAVVRAAPVLYLCPCYPCRQAGRQPRAPYALETKAGQWSLVNVSALAVSRMHGVVTQSYQALHAGAPPGMLSAPNDGDHSTLIALQQGRKNTSLSPLPRHRDDPCTGCALFVPTPGQQTLTIHSWRTFCQEMPQKKTNFFL